MMKKFLLTFVLLSFLYPAITYAQQTNNPACDDNVSNVSDVLDLLGCIIRKGLIPLLITLSIIIFIVGVIKYIAKADEATEREQGRMFMIYGIVALFVMVSIWGLVGIIQGTFGLGTNILIPQLQGI